MNLFRLLVAFLLLASCGCAGMRHTLKNPGTDQILRVSSGDRFSFELEENATTGYRWEATCDDTDVDVILSHRPAPKSGDPARCGAPGKVKVTIRVHRGYDGPSTIDFTYARPWEDKPARAFTITLYKRIGDFAAWE